MQRNFKNFLATFERFVISRPFCSGVISEILVFCTRIFSPQRPQRSRSFFKVFSVDSVRSVANLLVVDLVETWFRLVRVRKNLGVLGDLAVKINRRFPCYRARTRGQQLALGEIV